MLNRAMSSVISKRVLGFNYFPPGTVGHVKSRPEDPYFFETFVGHHKIPVPAGDSLYWIGADKSVAFLNRGPAQIESPIFATLVRGFSPENKSSSVTGPTVLPYINGCSTKQIFPPDRPGDPTMQLLYIPSDSSEQEHHIHSTARCVYILRGTGTAIVGMGKGEKVDLSEGGVCVIEPMAPHHFETYQQSLTVLPIHVWSSTDIENNHPMFNGTFGIQR